jgi:hypothetical protein
MGVNSSDLLRRAVQLARAGKKDEARDLFIRVVGDDPRNELAWMWLAGLVDSLEDQIIACENVLTINPANEKARAFLEELNRRKAAKETRVKVEEKPIPQRNSATSDPMATAKFLEQDGKLEEALMIYKVEAAKAKDTDTFNNLYRQITRIEQMQVDKIKYVPPRTSIIRLAITWPLLFLSLALVQVGLNPFRNPTIYLWFALPWVMAGSYLVAVSEVRSRHFIWRSLFFESGDGSIFARLTLGIAGWLMILIPIALIILDSLNRLSDFQIPPRLF